MTINQNKNNAKRSDHDDFDHSSLAEPLTSFNFILYQNLQYAVIDSVVAPSEKLCYIDRFEVYANEWIQAMGSGVALILYDAPEIGSTNERRLSCTYDIFVRVVIKKKF